MSQSPTTIVAVVLVAVVILILSLRCINILREYERGVVFRLGRAMKREKGPGFVFIFWPIDKLVKVSLRVVTWDVPTQDVITLGSENHQARFSQAKALDEVIEPGVAAACVYWCPGAELMDDRLQQKTQRLR